MSDCSSADRAVCVKRPSDSEAQAADLALEMKHVTAVGNGFKLKRLEHKHGRRKHASDQLPRLCSNFENKAAFINNSHRTFHVQELNRMLFV